MYLYESIEHAKAFGLYRPLPPGVRENLNPRLPLRPYQEAALRHFVTYYETEALHKEERLRTLFHMATGSGKTLVMAGLILYLYQKGYRNFLFFVNLSTIVQKTRDNFLCPGSSKYLFAPELCLDGRQVPIREVFTFRSGDPDAVNLLFTTTQGLHTALWWPREEAVTLDDFTDSPVVLLSDEAHHLNASTKAMSREEEDARRSWEQTVEAVFARRQDHVLLEFTATCDLQNPLILQAYESRIVFDYPLRRFHADGYSKEIVTLRTDLPLMDRALQALVLSQYRLKVFQDRRLSVKPVVLFKSAKRSDSRAFLEAFTRTLQGLTGDRLAHIAGLVRNQTMDRVWAYFAGRGVTFDRLAQELREDFSPGRILAVHDDRDVEEKQLILNSLEEDTNPYRAIFEVRKLDEGWDVLNLFDIVRTYETRQSSGRGLSRTTISEAQLIGRGARYCPFRLEEGQSRYQRKYDSDLGQEMRICEELYYHCQNDSRYIDELHRALREIGLDQGRKVQREHRLKASFRRSAPFREGYLLLNARRPADAGGAAGFLEEFLGRVYTVRLSTGRSGEDLLLEEDPPRREGEEEGPFTFTATFADLSRINYAIVHKALMQFPALEFSALRELFPALPSTRAFLTGGDYLGPLRLHLVSRSPDPPAPDLSAGARLVLGRLAAALADRRGAFVGTRTFLPRRLSELIGDKLVRYSDPHEGGAGVSQSAPTVPEEDRLDLSREDWYAFEDHFGNREEKAFVAYLARFLPRLRKRFDEVYLIRNERQFALYSFDHGARFEPDFVLLLGREGPSGREQLQVFLEPKGSHLIQEEQWKEDFLLSLSREVPARRGPDGVSYAVRGLHFFNRAVRGAAFDRDMEDLLGG